MANTSILATRLLFRLGGSSKNFTAGRRSKAEQGKPGQVGSPGPLEQQIMVFNQDYRIDDATALGSRRIDIDTGTSAGDCPANCSRVGSRPGFNLTRCLVIGFKCE